MSDRIATEDYVDAEIAAIPPGGGAVDSVNGQTGVVVLDAGDVGADVAGAAATAASGAASALASHDADTTAIHGIADTASLLTTATGQPLDSDLTAIAALTTTAFGRALLELANAAAGRTAFGLGTAAVAASGDFQPIDADLTAIAALTTTSYGRSLLEAANAAALRTLAGLVIGTDVQAQGAYAPGGTDVAVADGGTGAGTAAGARTNLGVAVPAPFGRTVNAGVVNYQLPGHAVTATATWASVINQLSYWPMWTPTAISIDQVAFNVTTTPASAAKVRIGIYLATSNNQPSGNPLSDSEVAVANGFTGVKTATVAVDIPPGPFLICVNNDVTMTMRGYTGALIAGHIPVGMGSATVMSFMAIASTYGAMPTPGTPWTFDTGGANMPVVVRVSTP